MFTVKYVRKICPILAIYMARQNSNCKEKDKYIHKYF